MAKGDGLVWIDGFDYYTNNNNSADKSPHARWYIPNNGETSGIVQAQTAASRYSSGKGMYVPNNRGVARVFGANLTDVILGGAVRLDAGAGEFNIHTFFDANTPQVMIAYDPSTRFFKAYRGNHSALLGTSTASAYSLQSAHGYVEVRAKINGSTGTIDIWFNGTNLLSLTNQNTQASGNAHATSAGFNYPNSPGSMAIDDAYAVNMNGSGTPERLGDVRIQARHPSAEGNSTQWTPLSGTDNALMVDETDPDDDSTYNSTATATNKDTYVIDDPTQQVGSVYAVGIMSRARKDDGGTREIANVARVSTNETDGATTAVGTAYQWYEDILLTKPGGGTWSISDVNNMEAGVKLVT